MKVILFGTTGMVGQGAPKSVLESPDIIALAAESSATH
jgi:hypothetical protein